MNNSRPIVNISLLLGTIIAVSAFFLVFNNIPVQALHKEQQLLESFDDLADFAKAVKSGDEELEEIPIQSMKAADIYDDADDNLKDCIDQAAEIGDSLTDREVVHCVDDVNYFNNKYSNSTVPTNATSTATIGLADTGTDTTSLPYILMPLIPHQLPMPLIPHQLPMPLIPHQLPMPLIPHQLPMPLIPHQLPMPLIPHQLPMPLIPHQLPMPLIPHQLPMPLIPHQLPMPLIPHQLPMILMKTIWLMN